MAKALAARPTRSPKPKHAFDKPEIVEPEALSVSKVRLENKFNFAKIEIVQITALATHSRQDPNPKNDSSPSEDVRKQIQ